MRFNELARLRRPQRVHEYRSETLTMADEWCFERQTTSDKAISAYLRKYVFLSDKLAFTGKGEMNYSTSTSTLNSYKNKDKRNF